MRLLASNEAFADHHGKFLARSVEWGPSRRRFNWRLVLAVALNAGVLMAIVGFLSEVRL